MLTGVHPSLSDSTIKDDTHNESSFQPSGAAWGQGSTSETATALKVPTGHNEVLNLDDKIVFKKITNRMETKYASIRKCLCKSPNWQSMYVVCE